MRAAVARALSALAARIAPKAAPSSLGGGQWSGTPFADAYKHTRAPSPNELMAELKGTAWACASINAAVCASFPPSVYVATGDGQHARPQVPPPSAAPGS